MKYYDGCYETVLLIPAFHPITSLEIFLGLRRFVSVSVAYKNPQTDIDS